MQLSKPQITWAALGIPVVAMFLIGLTAGVSGWVIGHALVGMVGVVIGGVAGGVTAKRFLAHAKGDGEVIYGLGAVTAIGVVAIGYIYLFYLDADMQTIGSTARAVEQTFIFVEFIAAQYVGTLWAERFLPGLKQEAGSKRQEAGGKKQEAGSKRRGDAIQDVE